MSSSAVFASNTGAGDAGQTRNVYVASLPSHFDDQQLHNLFSPYGRIISARIMRAKKSHLSKGYGFVMFREASAAEQAIQAVHGSVIEGSLVQVRWASADASTTFGKVSHTAAPVSESKVATNAASSASATASAAAVMMPYPSAGVNTHVTPVTGNLSTPQAYTFGAAPIQYEQFPQPSMHPLHSVGAAMALHQSYAPVLNVPLMPAQGMNVVHGAYPAQSMLPHLTPTPPQQPVYVVVLQSGTPHIVQLNQLAFQDM